MRRKRKGKIMKKRIKVWHLLAVLALIALAVSIFMPSMQRARTLYRTAMHRADERMRAMAGLGDADAAGQPPVVQFTAVVEPRKVVYSASFGMVVGDVRYVQDRIQELAEGLGGYMQQMGADFIVIRVPAEKFKQIEGMLAKFGSIASREVTAEDVTEQYYDFEVRLKNAQALAARLRELIKESRNVADTLAAEKELARVTTEIDRLEGVLNRLKNRIAYATVRVSLSRMREAPTAELVGKLPFAWLHDLGLDSLLSFE